jgi:hypothetical protein
MSVALRVDDANGIRPLSRAWPSGSAIVRVEIIDLATFNAGAYAPPRTLDHEQMIDAFAHRTTRAGNEPAQGYCITSLQSTLLPRTGVTRQSPRR